MHARTCRILFAGLLVLGFALISARAPAPVAAQPTAAASTLAAIDLGTLGGTYSFAAAVNDRGQVVGISETASSERHAFFWEEGVMTDLGLVGGGDAPASMPVARSWSIATLTQLKFADSCGKRVR